MVTTVAIELVLGMAIALVMHRAIFGRGVVRTSVLIPYGIITVVAAFAWQFAFAPDTGFVNNLPLIADEMDWFGGRFSSFAVIIMAEVWKTTPFMALLLLAGLVTIDDQLYEAAKVDGASAWQRFTRITLPLMKPAILVALLFRTLDAFRVFDTIFIMTRGAQDTESVSILGYNQLIIRLNLGLGSAVSVLIFLCVFLIAFVFVARLRDANSTKADREAEMEQRNSRDYALWSIAIVLVVVFALIPVLWLISISLKPPEALTDQRFIPSERLLRQLQEPVRRRGRRQPLHQAADQLDRDRADHDGDLDRPRLLRRLRDRPARIPRQAADPRRGAGDRDVPADLHRRAAVRHVAGAAASTTPGWG